MGMNPAHLAKLRTLSLDLLQMSLDLVGIVDQTGISDGANALISLARRDWWGAALSAVSAFPLVGDLAKVGKLGKYQKALREAVELAKQSVDVYKEIAPYLVKIRHVLDKIPAGENIEFISWAKRYLDDFFKVTTDAKKGITHMTEVLFRSKSLDVARNDALRALEHFIGPVPATRKVELGRLEKSALHGKEIGISYSNKAGDWGIIRLDYDPLKGPHYNVTVTMRGGVTKKFAYCFPGNEELIKALAKRRNPR